MVSSATLTMAMPHPKNCTTRYWNKFYSGLTEVGLTLNVDRCTFRVPKIKFLVNVMSVCHVCSGKPTNTQECR